MATKRTPFHEEFAKQIIEDLKTGTAPWQKPWQPGEFHPPFNPVSGTTYRGVNFVSLSRENLNDPRFMTLKQANTQDWKVKKGAKSRPIVFWQFSREEDVTDDKGKPVLDDEGKKLRQTVQLDRPILRFSRVFHTSQIEGIPEWDGRKIDWDPNERGEDILKGSGAAIFHDQRDRAFFRPSTDEIHIPPKGAFGTEHQYYATALHELGHWTGHPDRMNRDFGPKGSEEYAREELRAEIASWMLGGELGLGHDPEQHLAYVNSWVKVLEKDPYEIMRACQDAERIKNVMLGFEKGLSMDKQLQEMDMPSKQPKPRQEKQTTTQHVAEGVLPENPTSEKTFLSVPYKEKNQAKAAGARWDRKQKLWFAPKGADMAKLNQWLPKHHNVQPTPAMSPEREFAEAIREAGLDLGGELPLMNGELHRVPLLEGKQGTKDGAYKGYLDGHPAGFIQNHKTGLKQKWKATGHKLSTEEKAELKAQAAQKEQLRRQERNDTQEKAAKRAYAKWMNGKGWANEDQNYLQKKGVKGFGVKLDMHGNLLIPGRDAEGRIHTLQTISPEGKFFERGARKTGTFHTIDPQKTIGRKRQPIMVAEGYATAASAHMATGKPAVVAFDAGNLDGVARELKAKYPDSPILFLADDDHAQKNNPGLTKAHAAAEKVGGAVIEPKLTSDEKAKGLTDFNDIHKERGLEALKVELTVGIKKATSKG